MDLKLNYSFIFVLIIIININLCHHHVLSHSHSSGKKINLSSVQLLNQESSSNNGNYGSYCNLGPSTTATISSSSSSGGSIHTRSRVSLPSSTITPCDPKFECINNKCVCKSGKHQIYDERSNECKSLVGGPCSNLLSVNNNNNNNDDVPIINCIDHAICMNKGYYEACECESTHVENSEGTCSLGVGSDCATENSCEANLVCRAGKCDCPDELEVYDLIKKKCRGLVGATCKTKTELDYDDDYCVEKAHCVVTNPKLRGRCSCISAYDEWSDRFCERFDDERTNEFDLEPRYQTTEDYRQRLRTGGVTSSTTISPRSAARYYRRKNNAKQGQQSTTSTSTTTTTRTTTPSYSYYGHRQTERTTRDPSGTTKSGFGPGSGEGNPNSFLEATTDHDHTHGWRNNWRNRQSASATTTASTTTTTASPISGYVPANCPTSEVSDCMYENCKLTGCTDGKICCPKPCGGNWCVRPIR